jgi:hypothetical protein
LERLVEVGREVVHHNVKVLFFALVSVKTVPDLQDVGVVQ